MASDAKAAVSEFMLVDPSHSHLKSAQSDSLRDEALEHLYDSY